MWNQKNDKVIVLKEDIHKKPVIMLKDVKETKFLASLDRESRIVIWDLLNLVPYSVIIDYYNKIDDMAFWSD